MRGLAPIIATLLLLGLSPTASATTDTVHLTVDGDEVFPFNLPPYNEAPVTASCNLTVADDADGGDVLDEAVDTGCLSSWDYRLYDGSRFLTGINDTHGHCSTDASPPGLWPVVCSYWEFQVNGNHAGYGIDGYLADDGDQITFRYNRTTMESVD